MKPGALTLAILILLTPALWAEELNMLYMAQAGYQPSDILERASSFEEQTGITVNLWFVEYEDQYNLIDPIPAHLVETVRQGIIPEIYSAFSYDAHIWAVPFLANFQLFYTNMELLHQAGYPQGSNFPRVRFVSFKGSETRVEYLCSRLRDDLGIDIHGETLEFGTLLQRLDALETHLFLIGWLADFPDPITFLRDCPFQTWTGWSNPEYTSLIAEASQSVDTDAHIRLCQQAESILIEESPIVPMNYARHNLLVKPWVTRFSPPVMGVWFFKDVVVTSR